MLAGRDPTSVSHLIERDLTAFPAVTDGMSDLQKSNLIEKRAEIEYKNKIIRNQRAEHLKDHKNRLAHKIIASLRPRAGLRLRSLQTDHLVEGAIDRPDATYDGIAMYKELMELRTQSLSKPQRDEIKQRLTDFESSHLADGCTVQDFADKVNYFIRDINPYLTRKYQGEELGEYIVELLPPSRKSDGVALMRELRRDRTLGTHTEVTAACTEIISARSALAAHRAG